LVTTRETPADSDVNHGPWSRREAARAYGGAGSVLFVLFVPFEADRLAPKRTEADEADEADVFSVW
jgi:hypothetical protein